MLPNLALSITQKYHEAVVLFGQRCPLEGREMRSSGWVVSSPGVAAVSLALFVGWSSARTTAPVRQTVSIKVGLITKTDTNPFFVQMKEGASKQAKALRATLPSAAGKIDG